MDRDRNFVPPYDRDYAQSYNAIWPENEEWKELAGLHVGTLRSLMRPETNWLDCGCGTGYFLSQFKGVRRAGFDYSEPMLEEARKANDDAVFFERHDISRPRPEWNGRWDVVSCTGQPWSYLPDMERISQTVRNFYDWTSPGGTCFNTPVDAEELYGIRANYDFSIEEADNKSIVVNGVIWTWIDLVTKTKHPNLIFPSLDQWVRWYSMYFNEIEIGKWPGLGLRRYLLCRKKKDVPNTDPPVILGLENAHVLD